MGCKFSVKLLPRVSMIDLTLCKWKIMYFTKLERKYMCVYVHAIKLEAKLLKKF